MRKSTKPPPLSKTEGDMHTGAFLLFEGRRGKRNQNDRARGVDGSRKKKRPWLCRHQIPGRNWKKIQILGGCFFFGWGGGGGGGGGFFGLFGCVCFWGVFGFGLNAGRGEGGYRNTVVRQVFERQSWRGRRKRGRTIITPTQVLAEPGFQAGRGGSW